MSQSMNSDPLERLLESYYQVETAHVHAAPGLWQSVEQRIAEQEAPATLAPAPRASARRAASAPLGRPSRARRYIFAAACAAAALTIAVGIATTRSRYVAPEGTALIKAPTAPIGGIPTPSAGPGASQTQVVPVGPAPTLTASQGLPKIAGGTGQPQTPSEPGLSGSVALLKGTLEEAQRAVGVTILLPRYLPAGAEREDELVHYYVRGSEGMASLAYRVGLRSLALEFVRTPAGQMPALEGEPTTVGPFQAAVHTTPREPSDPLPPMSEVAWRDGEVTVRVRGDLPPEELLNVARSLYSTLPTLPPTEAPPG